MVTMMLASRRFLTRFRIMAIIVSLILNVAIVGTGGIGWSAESEETIPDENDHLTLSELRWCTFESARLDGESNELDAHKGWEVDSYNARINHYNHRCSDKSYYESDETTVEREMTMAKHQYLQGQGALRVKKARVDREKKRAYVNSEVARILAAPEDSAIELVRVSRWGELIKTGRVQGRWYEVEWKTPSLDNVLKFGWVLAGVLEGGSGSEARFVYCEKHKEGRAKHDEIVRKEFDLRSAGAFRVENGLGEDAYVKLVRDHDRAVVSLYVAARKTASLEGISAGSYDIVFATGSKFSRGCDSFSRRGNAQRFAEGIDYDHQAVVWTVTLHSLSDGNVRASSISYDDFDKL